jgi:uncharacterized protein
MSDENKPVAGTVCWYDLTVPNAEEIRDFYQAVVGWTSTAEDMEDYEDYNMIAGDGDTAAGICHARGENSDVPPQWMIYIVVEDVDAAAEKCVAMGGRLMAGPRDMGEGRFCVIRDPAGAMCALYKP